MSEKHGGAAEKKPKIKPVVQSKIVKREKKTATEKKKETHYELLWRNKDVTSTADSIDDMIHDYEENLETLRTLKRIGAQGDFCAAADDIIWFNLSEKKFMESLNFHFPEEDKDH